LIFWSSVVAAVAELMLVPVVAAAVSLIKQQYLYCQIKLLLFQMVLVVRPEQLVVLLRSQLETASSAPMVADLAQHIQQADCALQQDPLAEVEPLPLVDEAEMVQVELRKWDASVKAERHFLSQELQRFMAQAAAAADFHLLAVLPAAALQIVGPETVAVHLWQAAQVWLIEAAAVAAVALEMLQAEQAATASRLLPSIS
jgi:hypothetical protein